MKCIGGLIYNYIFFSPAKTMDRQIHWEQALSTQRDNPAIYY